MFFNDKFDEIEEKFFPIFFEENRFLHITVLWASYVQKLAACDPLYSFRIYVGVYLLIEIDSRYQNLTPVQI